jgi:hypothetical protein
MYQVFCSNCHGSEARGDGPTAEHLTVRPADLTRLSAGNGGTFPAEQVHEQIDGRTELPGHGRRQMPIWGLSFQEPGFDGDQEPMVRARIAYLVAYLETIQAELP